MKLPHVEVLDMIFDKFSFLTNVFTSKPNNENLLAFVLAICICPNSTISGFADWFENWKNQSTLNRFLTNSTWTLSVLHQKYSMWIKKILESTTSNIYFIFDDTKSEKTGSLIERTTRDFDHVKKMSILCHTFVASVIKIGDFELPFMFTLYDKTKKENFKSKLDLAVGHIRKFLQLITPFIPHKKIIFLFDSWYCNPKIISALPKGTLWVSRLKKNRTVKIGNFWCSLEELKRRVKPHDFKRVKVKKKYYWACSTSVVVKGLGILTVVLVKPLKYSQYIEFFVSNMDKDAETILRHYGERWEIEVFFRTLKQSLGLGGYQMRKYKGNRRHWSLVLLSYAILSVLQKCWKRTCKTIGDTIAKLRKIFKNGALDYDRSFGRLIENYVGKKFAKV